jgi:hypothetical protein
VDLRVKSPVVQVSDLTTLEIARFKAIMSVLQKVTFFGDVTVCRGISSSTLYRA